MFAVLKTGGKQYRVAANQILTVEKLPAEAGETVEFNEVLMLGGDDVRVGAPFVAGAVVKAEVLEQLRGEKVISFKKRRRKNSRRKRGYRHEFSVIRITEILTGGAKPSKEAKPRPRKEPKPKAEGEAAEAKPAKAKPKKPAAKKPATKGKKK